MDKETFIDLVGEAVEGLPEEFRARLENVAIVVADYPSQEQIKQAGLRERQTLLGLYQGVPLTKRGAHYGMVPPDKITIFQKPIEARCKNESRIVAEIRRVVRHEIAHHFGIGDGRLRELEEGNR